MAYTSIQQVFALAGLAQADQLQQWHKAWQLAVENGSTEPMMAFFCRELGISEDQFLQKLAKVLNWKYVDLPRLSIAPEARQKISTKVAFQHVVMPIQFENDILEIAINNPFSTALLNSVRFAAQCPVRFALAPQAEIEKALKKYYGVGA